METIPGGVFESEVLSRAMRKWKTKENLRSPRVNLKLSHKRNEAREQEVLEDRMLAWMLMRRIMAVGVNEGQLGPRQNVADHEDDLHFHLYSIILISLTPSQTILL